MAQLPPKAPSMTHYYHHYHNWPSSSASSSSTATTSSSSSSSFHHQKLLPSMSNFHLPNHITNINQLQPSWVDDFLDFSSTRRVAHRRSVSADSFAFLLDDCSNSINHNNNINSDDMAAEANCFERLDDDQLMSLFSDDVSMTLHPPTASSSNPSTPSDQNSNNDDKPTTLDQQQQQQPKNEPGEVESSCKFEAQLPTQTTTTTTTTTSNADQLFDPKRVKRILANRQSAQRSRVRKLQYISELERSVTTLQTEVSALSPRVAFLDHQRLILNVDNSAIKQRIAALAQDKIFKDAHQEALKKEIGRLRQVYHQQSLNKINTTAAASNTNNSNAAAAPPQPMSTDTNNMVCTDKEQQLLN